MLKRLWPFAAPLVAVGVFAIDANTTVRISRLAY